MTGAEALIEQGIEQGAREMLIHNIFTVLYSAERTFFTSGGGTGPRCP